VRKLLYILLLLPTLAWPTNRVDYEDDAQFTASADVLGIPRWKCAVSPENIGKRWAISSDSLWYSSDSGKTWSTRIRQPSAWRDIHNGISPLYDSIGIARHGTVFGFQIMVDGDTATGQSVTNADGSTRGVVIGDSTTGVFWLVLRELNTSPDNCWAYFTDDGGATWDTESFTDLTDAGADCRVGGFQWHDGIIITVLDFEDDSFRYFKADTTNGVTALSDSVIVDLGSGEANNSRSFTMNGYYNDDDTLLMLVYGWNDSLLCQWQHEAQTSWTSITVVADGGETWLDWKPHLTIQNDLLVLYYTDADTVWAKVFDPVAETFSARHLISAGVSGAIEANVPQHCQGQVGFAQIGTGSPSAMYNYRTWATPYDTVINDLPFTIITGMNGTSGDPYDIRVHPQDSTLASDDGIFTFNTGTHDVTIDLFNDTLDWNQDGSLNEDGISANNSYNVNITGGYIIQDSPAAQQSADTLLRADCIVFGAGGYGWTFTGTFFQDIGRNGQIAVAYSNYNITFDSCIFNSLAASFTQRDLMEDAATISFVTLDDADAQTDFTHHLYMRKCSTIVDYWINVYVEGDSGVVILDTNYQMVDARNDFDTTADPVHGSAAQCYATLIRGPGAATSSRIILDGNTIRSGTSYGGGRGIFISGNEGMNLSNIDSAITFIRNDISVHMEYDEEDSTCNGIIVRQGWKNVWIEDNTIEVTGTGTPGSGSGPGPHSGIRLTGGPIGDGLFIRGNLIRTYITGSWTPDYSDNGRFAACIMFDEFNQNTPNVTIDSNRFESNSLLVRWGFFNGQGGNVTMFADTFADYSGETVTLDWTFYLGYGASNSLGAHPNWVIDPVMVGAASDTNMFVDDAEPDSLSLGLQVIYTGTVTRSGSPVASADYWIVDAYGDTTSQGTTNGSGEYSDTITYWREFNDTFSHPDSVGFNAHTIGAAESGDTSSASFTMAWNNKDTTLTLAASSSTTVQVSGSVSLSGKVIVQ